MHLRAALLCAGTACREDAVGGALVARQLMVELLLCDRLAQRQVPGAGCLRGDSHRMQIVRVVGAMQVTDGLLPERLDQGAAGA